MALTPCGCTEVLEPDPATIFNVCDNAGSAAFTEAGVTTIPNGAVAIDVTFATEKASADYGFVEREVENTLDSNPKVIDTQIISRTTIGFRAIFDSTPDSPNYSLRWSVFVQTISGG